MAFVLVIVSGSQIKYSVLAVENVFSVCTVAYGAWTWISIDICQCGQEIGPSLIYVGAVPLLLWKHEKVDVTVDGVGR